MKTKFSRGFTLIELLVVIAIIGVLASVVLASLNSARSKGNDSAIKSNLSNMRAAAEIHYDSNSNSYATFCASTGATQQLAAANTANGSGAADCNSTASQWAAAAVLSSNTGQFFCVDSTGAAKVVTGVVSDTNGSAFDMNLPTLVCP